MASDHSVQSGDCLSSIAEDNGFFLETLWAHPNNAGLLRADTHNFRAPHLTNNPRLQASNIAHSRPQILHAKPEPHHDPKVGQRQARPSTAQKAGPTHYLIHLTNPTQMLR